MAILTAIDTQTSIFAGSLTGKTAPTKEAVEPDVSQASKIPAQGDRITLSQEARALSAAEKSSNSDSSDEDQLIKTLKERIQKLREDIQEIENDDTLSEDARVQKVQGKETELMQLLDQLARAEAATAAAAGYNPSGGTRANGFSNSLT